VPVLAQLEKDFPNNIRIVYRNYPLIGTPDKPFHDKAALSTQAAEAAGLQGKFWEMHDLLFNRQTDWATLTVDQFKDWLIAQAKDLGLDVKKFTSDLTSPQMVKVAQDAWDNGQKIGLPGTPFLIVNGRIWPNNVPMDYANLSAVIKLTELEKKQFTYCPPMAIDMLKQYTATVKTTKGDIVIELYADKAPLAVNSFIFLARNGWFNGVTFHRVIPGFVAQAGDPSGTGYGGPGYAFKNEIAPGLKFDREGVVGMASAGPDSNGSQFFITLGPAPNLDGSYTIFGQVISGMDVVKSLTPRDTSKTTDLPPGDVITSVTIIEK
jgi:cyclophilin family peptidyl-prolyl cis-trans isomerase/thiol-disulfide isomerase/thioredoxin